MQRRGGEGESRPRAVSCVSPACRCRVPFALCPLLRSTGGHDLLPLKKLALGVWRVMDAVEGSREHWAPSDKDSLESQAKA